MTTVEMTIRLSVEEILHALWQLPSHEREYVQNVLAAGQPNSEPITSQTLDSNAFADRDAIFGIWADRTDISDSVAYSAMLRQRLTQRSDAVSN